jgi:5-methylcytosine-specific restriction endonuclease McrA
MGFTKASRICLLSLLSNSSQLKWACNHCGRESDDPSFFDVDHVLAKSKKGTDDYSNLEVLCPNCHREKSLRENDLGGSPGRPKKSPATNPELVAAP